MRTFFLNVGVNVGVNVGGGVGVGKKVGVPVDQTPITFLFKKLKILPGGVPIKIYDRF